MPSLVVLRKPQGEITQIASYGLMKWGKDESGKTYVQWNDTEWLPSILEYEEQKLEEKEEKENLFFIEEFFLFFFCTNAKRIQRKQK